MDGKRFDRLSVALAQAAPRRRALRLAAGAALAGLLARRDRPTAAATCTPHRKPCRRDDACCSGFCQRNGPCAAGDRPTGKCRCRCPKGRSPCGTGPCCGGGERCEGGVCVAQQCRFDGCPITGSCNNDPACACVPAMDDEQNRCVIPNGLVDATCGQCATDADCQTLYPGQSVTCVRGCGCPSYAPGICGVGCPKG